MYSLEQLRELRQGRASVTDKHLELMKGYLSRSYGNERAREYATHGFMRRIKTLTRCIANVYEILPPDRTSIPTMDELSDVAINIQAFVFNAFGSADNLAWIWLLEKGVTNKDGSELRSNHVGLRIGNTTVRKSFSAEFRTYLEGLDKWFEYQEDFRHSLAHRIPLYIPQYIVHPNDELAYRALTEQATAALNRLDVPEYDRLTREQDKLGAFSPRMTHSFTEAKGTVYFHVQLLADFNTVHELGVKMLEKLNR